MHLIAQATAPDTAADGDSAQPSGTVVIEDVKTFKASMPLSAGATPVKDLSEYEELGSKL